MNDIDTAFDDLISEIKMNTDGELTASGWYAVNCPMCNNKNESQKKGGFKFDPDTIAWHCFKGKCESATVYTKGEGLSKKFRDLMDTIGVQIPMELKAYSKNKKRTLFDSNNSELYEKNMYHDVQFLSHFTDSIPDGWVEELADRRTIHDIGFKVASKGDYKGSLVIPHWFFDKLIGWDYWTESGKYITSEQSNSNLIFVPERYIPKTVFLVEGIFDALCFPNTVAVKKSKVDAKQAYHLRNSRVIVIPDRSKSDLYESAKYFGWEISIPMWKEKDLNEAVKNKGLLVTARMIYDGTMKPSPKSDIYYKRWIGI